MQDPDQPPQQAIGSHRDKGMVEQYLKSPHLTGMLRPRAYELTEEEKVPVIKIGRVGGSTDYKDIYT